MKKEIKWLIKLLVDIIKMEVYYRRLSLELMYENINQIIRKSLLWIKKRFGV